MRRLLQLGTGLAFLFWSCEEDSPVAVVTVEEQLAGNWEFKSGQVGTAVIIPSLEGPATFDFREDLTFTRVNSPVPSNGGSKDEGTWTYEKSDSTLTLTYKSYKNSQQIGDTWTQSLMIYSITEEALVLRSDYNDTMLGQFVKFSYSNYKRK